MAGKLRPAVVIVQAAGVCVFVEVNLIFEQWQRII